MKEYHRMNTNKLSRCPPATLVVTIYSLYAIVKFYFQGYDECGLSKRQQKLVWVHERLL